MDDCKHPTWHRSGPTTKKYEAQRSVVPKMKKPILDVWRNCIPNTQTPQLL